MNEATNNEEDEGNELYRDLNVNLEGSETVTTVAPLHHVQATQETKDTHVILTAPINSGGQHQSSSVSSGFVSNMLNPRPDTSIDSIFNTEATSLVDVPITNIAELPLVFATTLPPPPTTLITHMQQTPFPIPTTAPSTSLQDLPNFGSLFGIVDNYLANKMNEAIKTDVQLQSDRLREEAQSENEDFLNKHEDNIKKIIKDQVKEQVKAQVSKILPKIKKTTNEQLVDEVMTRSSTESMTSLAIATNLYELELKKILIEKMESNKSINRSNEQKNLYKALVEAYESDKLILDTYGNWELLPETYWELLPKEILGATTQRDTGSYYPKRYWELLPKEILGATTQRDTGSYYPKRYWKLLPKEILGSTTQRDTGMSYGKMVVT
ncbi:hypothetical protein Tco_1072512 [Tanacetum coccineum]